MFPTNTFGLQQEDWPTTFLSEIKLAFDLKKVQMIQLASVGLQYRLQFLQLITTTVIMLANTTSRKMLVMIITLNRQNKMALIKTNQYFQEKFLFCLFCKQFLM